MVSCLIELPEHETKEFEKGEIPEDVGKIIYDKYSKQVDIEFPNYKSNQKWRLTNKGWVGFAPLNDDFSLKLKPKIPINNLFKMWEYAYKLRSFHFLDALAECDSLEGFYERLANILVELVGERIKKGLYRSYIDESNEIAFITGRIDIRSVAAKPWESKVLCQYQEHTSDIEDNQLLTWTLYTIARSGICTERVLPKVRATYRSLIASISLKPYSYKQCTRRIYNRLNQDYETMHAICRFFLEQSGPSQESGDHTMLPFLVDMARLYELFVAEWLRVHLPANFKITAQERVHIGEFDELNFAIDLVLYDALSGEAVAVMDTKYKNSDSPAQSDFNQIVTYANIKNSKNAILVYPTHLSKPFKWTSPEGVNIHTVIFDIGKDIKQAGQDFLGHILNKVFEI